MPARGGREEPAIGIARARPAHSGGAIAGRGGYQRSGHDQLTREDPWA